MTSCFTRRQSTVLRPRRRGGSTLFFVIGFCVVAALIGGIVFASIKMGGKEVTEMPLMAEVTSGSYDHVVLEQGEVESSNNVEIRCEVRARTSGSGPSTSIIDVIPEGSMVKPGDWLITFDSSALEQETSAQRIMVNTSEAIMIQAKAFYDTALIAKDEYFEGTYNELRKGIQNEIFVAEENLKKAQLSYASIKRLVSRGLLTSLQLEGERFRVDASQNELELAEQKLEVLAEYTKLKMLTQLESDIKSADVKYRNEQDSYKEEVKKLKEIQDQVAKCVVVAPQAGQVVYANVQSSRSGSEFVCEPGVAVRERQVIIRLPDPSKMQVKANISESRINLVKAGMPVSIRIDAFGDVPLEGEVTKVNKYAEPGNWWSSSSKEYVTLVQIFDPPPLIRVGLTAEVQILVESRDSALQMPVQAVFERHGKTFCLVHSNDKFDTREMLINSTNEKVVSLDESASELKSGESVVMNPRKHLELFDQSKLPEEPKGQKTERNKRGAETADASASGSTTVVAQDEAAAPVRLADSEEKGPSAKQNDATRPNTGRKGEVAVPTGGAQ
jgi:multidrug resistance efflux pump